MNFLKNILRLNNVEKDSNVNQKIDLIPVIELIYGSTEIEVPKHPYWENIDLWEHYNQNCYRTAGFIDELKPYIKGSHFFKLDEISNRNLTKITIDHTNDLRNGKYQRKDAIGFSGGYVLRINEIDEFFPQCCGELSDISFWQNISNYKDSYCEGHPVPQHTFQKNVVILDFAIGEFDEYFKPPLNYEVIKLNITELKNAVEKVIIELKNFEKQLEQINFTENLNIEKIGKLLIWENLNYQ